ncbi:MAG: cytochrome c oxidase subunit 3 [Legionellales bacterium]|jgi:cytochrome c oxidase subunit 3|nr:cytochrome c oxidase subunit 3 [Legionellales bacterium]|tara:strand:+ start:7513 stop:8403 length:891 start_codon:yes stop_codon:yes gene_type:complete
MSNSNDTYFIPEPSRWPIVGTLALFVAFIGGGMVLNGYIGSGQYVLALGILAIIYLFYGWFKDVIDESIAGKYNEQVDISFRWGMAWFIFSEVMFFAAFFGALFYTRVLSIPWLGLEESVSNQFLWPDFQAVWPLLTTPDMTIAGLESKYIAIKEVIPAWDIPAWNTAILLTSGATVTFAHWALKKGNRSALCWWLAATVLLGIIFVYLQVAEYGHAYHELDLTLKSGVYGSTFFMLTGFHGFHVTMGATMLAVILVRSMLGHFSEHNHFAFEAVAWYWHFVDVVWLGLFVFVYWV